MATYKLSAKLNVFLLLLLMALAGSCTRVEIFKSYGYWAVQWKLDDYFDLNRKQDQLVKEEYQLLMRQLESEIFIDVHALLGEVISLVETQKMTRGEFNNIQQQTLSLFARLGEYLVTPSVRFLMTLSKDQIDTYAEVVAEKKQEELEASMKPAHERRQDSVKRWQTNLSEWVGESSDKQDALLIAFYNNHEFPHAERQAFRDQSNVRFIALLTQKNERSLQEYVRAFFLQPESLRGASYHKELTTYQSQITDLLFEIFAVNTPKQNEHLIKKLRLLQQALKAKGDSDLKPH